MNKKVVKLVFASFLLLALIIFSNVNARAQDLEDIENNSVVRGVDELREIAEERKWEFLSEQWKEILLKNRFISKIDSFFTKINFIFVFLMSRNYSLSLELFFVFLIWLFTLLSLYAYSSYFFDNDIYRGLIALAGTVIFSWLQIFNILGKGIIRLIFFSERGLISFFTSLLIFVLIFVYLFLNKMFAARLKEDKEEARKREFEHKVAVEEKFREGVSKAI